MIEQIVKDFSIKYAWHFESQSPQPGNPSEGINSGLCDLFAEEVNKHHPQTIIHYDDDIDHYYCEIDGKFYDAENPKGALKKEKMVFLGKFRVGQTVINEEINKLVALWGVNPIDINGGRCEDFAMFIIDQMGGYSDELYELCTTNFDPEWKMDLPNHVWVFYKGRHYDAESPHGVEDWQELPIFKQFAVCDEVR